MAESDQADLTTLTVQLLSAYFSNNSVGSGEIAGLIETTRTALAGKNEPETPAAPEYSPAVTARKSLGSRDHILSMIDGKPYKTLKRHLAGHGLTPAEYRSRYNLPNDYPMVAPGYSEQRRAVAKRLGLGRRSSAAASPEQGTPDSGGGEREAAAPDSARNGVKVAVSEASNALPKNREKRVARPKRAAVSTTPSDASSTVSKDTVGREKAVRKNAKAGVAAEESGADPTTGTKKRGRPAAGGAGATLKSAPRRKRVSGDVSGPQGS